MSKEFVSTHEKIFGHNYGGVFFSCAQRKTLLNFIGKVFV